MNYYYDQLNKEQQREGRSAKSAGFVCSTDAFKKRTIGYLFHDSSGLSIDLLFSEIFV